jgi:hypothetical protein
MQGGQDSFRSDVYKYNKIIILSLNAYNKINQGVVTKTKNGIKINIEQFITFCLNNAYHINIFDENKNIELLLVTQNNILDPINTTNDQAAQSNQADQPAQEADQPAQEADQPDEPETNLLNNEIELTNDELSIYLNSLFNKRVHSQSKEIITNHKSIIIDQHIINMITTLKSFDFYKKILNCNKSIKHKNEIIINFCNNIDIAFGTFFQDISYLLDDKIIESSCVRSNVTIGETALVKDIFELSKIVTIQQQFTNLFKDLELYSNKVESTQPTLSTESQPNYKIIIYYISEEYISEDQTQKFIYLVLLEDYHKEFDLQEIKVN